MSIMIKAVNIGVPAENSEEFSVPHILRSVFPHCSITAERVEFEVVQLVVVAIAYVSIKQVLSEDVHTE